VSWPRAKGRGQVGTTVRRFEVTLEELRQVRRRIDEQQLDADDWPLLGALVSRQIGWAEARLERMIAKIGAVAAEQKAGGEVVDANGSVDACESTGSTSSSDAKATSSTQGESRAGGDGAADRREPAKCKGHGRNGARAYSKAKHLFYALAAGVMGAVCQVCGLGKMYRYREKVVIRIVGQPLFSAEVHHFEQARCRNCGQVVRADSPACIHEGIGSDYVRYDWSACAMLMVMHYFGGGPFKRLESLHQGWGVPMPDANQWEVVDAGDDLLLPLYRALEQHAIRRATNFRIDDTGSMVIALHKQIEAEIAALERLGESTKDVRTGINATGTYWETPDGPVTLFYTGRHHAGEIVDQLLRHRLLSKPKLVKCTDGASKNFDHEQADKLVEATCNAHALLKFRDIRDKHAAEYAEAGRVYKQVFDNDDKAKALGLTPIDRMLYHRQHSKPLMQELKAMCEQKLKSKLCEPNSPLWEPLTFVLNQWDRLTRFCEVPGVPLDTNLVEQALIIPVRYLAGSFNYQSEDGAVVGDHAMSLIATARANDVEPVAYLTECLRCHEDLAKRPEHYLPWVYRERLKKGQSPPATARERSGPPAPARELRDLAPQLREDAALRVAAPDQDLQLASEQR
jgi:transposase